MVATKFDCHQTGLLITDTFGEFPRLQLLAELSPRSFEFSHNHELLWNSLCILDMVVSSQTFFVQLAITFLPHRQKSSWYPRDLVLSKPKGSSQLLPPCTINVYYKSLLIVDQLVKYFWISVLWNLWPNMQCQGSGYFIDKLMVGSVVSHYHTHAQPARDFLMTEQPLVATKS